MSPRIPTSARSERGGLNQKFGLKLTDKQHDEMTTLAFELGVSAADVMRAALDDYLVAHRVVRLRRRHTGRIKMSRS